MPDLDKSVLKPVLGALAAALVVLVLFVLPAEHGIDPTGIGGALGLTDMAEAPTHALTPAQSPLVTDEISFTLEPYESVEYKYHLIKEAGIVFSWTATAPVAFDLHAELEGSEEAFEESFSQGKSEQEAAAYIATFPGIHGWFWENRNAAPVTITLTASGFINGATIFRDGSAQHVYFENKGTVE